MSITFNNKGIGREKLTEKSEKSFQYEWNFYKLDNIQREYYKEYTFEFLQEKPSYFKDKTVLEIGCGAGRMTQILAPLSKEYTAIDLTNAINRIKPRKNLKRIRIDLMSYNPRKKYDFIFSRGVLHHLPNPKKAFDKSVSLLKENGVMVIGVYKKRNLFFEMVNTLIRNKTTKMPHDKLYNLCKKAAFLVPLAYKLMNKRKKRPLTKDESTWLLFDWFSPEYQYHLSEKELDEWTDGLDVLGKKVGWRKIRKGHDHLFSD